MKISALPLEDLREKAGARKQHPLRDKLESAALRLDDVLGAELGHGSRESILLAAARDIAQALDLIGPE
jgi:hypothetical protein